MGFEDNVYKYLGLSVLIIFVLYILIKSLVFQVNIVEGLTNQDKDKDNKTDKDKDNANIINIETNKLVQKHNDKMDETLNINKNKKDYENMLIQLDDYSKASMLSKLVNINSKIAKLDLGKDVPDEIMNEIEKVNTLKSFTDILNSSMVYIDKKTKSGMF
jgi:hypothetical protein